VRIRDHALETRSMTTKREKLIEILTLELSAAEPDDVYELENEADDWGSTADRIMKELGIEDALMIEPTPVASAAGNVELTRRLRTERIPPQEFTAPEAETSEGEGQATEAVAK